MMLKVLDQRSPGARQRRISETAALAVPMRLCTLYRSCGVRFSDAMYPLSRSTGIRCTRAVAYAVPVRRLRVFARADRLHRPCRNRACRACFASSPHVSPHVSRGLCGKGRWQLRPAMRGGQDGAASGPVAAPENASGGHIHTLLGHLQSGAFPVWSHYLCGPFLFGPALFGKNSSIRAKNPVRESRYSRSGKPPQGTAAIQEKAITQPRPVNPRLIRCLIRRAARFPQRSQDPRPEATWPGPDPGCRF